VQDVNLRELIEEILRDTREMVLATASEKGPWVTTLVFGHDQNLNLYWISYEVSRHTKELDKNPQVAAVVNKQPTGGGNDKGLQVEGKAFSLKEEEILPAAREYFAKRGTPHMPTTLEEANELAEGRSWFVLRPTKIYVYYGPLFGYDRKEYTP